MTSSNAILHSSITSLNVMNGLNSIQFDSILYLWLFEMGSNGIKS
jgi:hypothetical protein